MARFLLVRIINQRRLGPRATRRAKDPLQECEILLGQLVGSLDFPTSQSFVAVKQAVNRSRLASKSLLRLTKKDGLQYHHSAFATGVR
jgi:hypothetical protein